MVLDSFPALRAALRASLALQGSAPGGIFLGSRSALNVSPTAFVVYSLWTGLDSLVRAAMLTSAGIHRYAIARHRHAQPHGGPSRVLCTRSYRASCGCSAWPCSAHYCPILRAAWVQLSSVYRCPLLHVHIHKGTLRQCP